MRPTTLERAFELAESGEFLTTGGIAKALKREGYFGVDPLFAQDAVRRRLSGAILEAREALLGIVIEDASVDIGAIAGLAARAKASSDNHGLHRSAPQAGHVRPLGG